MKIKKYFSATFFISIPVMTFNYSAFSQVKYYKGYVILINGDTLKGEIKKNPKNEFDNFRKAVYRKGEGLPMKSYGAEKVKEYNIDGDIFLSRMIEDEAVFVKRILVGTYNLYEAQIETMQSNKITAETAYFIEKSGSTDLIKIIEKSSKFKKQMMDIMSDNKDIVKALEAEKYTYKNITELFEAYNKSAKTN
jgi:hypothetical protein